MFWKSSLGGDIKFAVDLGKTNLDRCQCNNL